VIRIRGADEAVVRDLPGVGDTFEGGGVAVDERSRLDTGGPRRLHVLGAVLVRTGQEEHLVASLPPHASESVRAGELVGMVKSGRVVDVRDRRRDIELHRCLLGILG
jgi:hypothetical protein